MNSMSIKTSEGEIACERAGPNAFSMKCHLIIGLKNDISTKQKIQFQVSEHYDKIKVFVAQQPNRF